MDAPTVTKEQRDTRRRALGRLLIAKSSNLAVDLAAIQGSPDYQFLTPKEAQRFLKLNRALEKVYTEYTRLGEHLEKSE